MGLFDAILGRRKPVGPNLDALFALPSAAITLQVSLDQLPTGRGAVAFRAPEGRAFADVEDEVRRLLDESSARVSALLEARRPALDRIAAALLGSTVSRGCELAAQPVVRSAASATTTSVGAWRFVIPAG